MEISVSNVLKGINDILLYFISKFLFHIQIILLGAVYYMSKLVFIFASKVKAHCVLSRAFY